MQRRLSALALVPLLLIGLPHAAKAGGPEFPAGGTRSLGRGAASFARTDDPSVMVRNPAGLADLWDDQALLGAHLLLPDACMTPTGYYGWNVATDDVANFGEGPRYLQANQGMGIDPNMPPHTSLNGTPLKGYGNTAFPKVCYQGPAPFLPQLALSMKPTRDLGVGIGFFPPDTAALNQWGNRDGLIDTDNGKLPNPLRYYRSHLNVTFFSLMGGVGYRLAPWISIGAAFQWTLVAFYGRSWTEANPVRNPSQDIKTDVFGRDLFIPGGIVSVELRPIDSLDIVAGFKWSDRVKSYAKLDITTGAFGTGEPFTYLRNGTPTTIQSSVPFRNPPVRGSVDSPPVWVPQLALGLRFADRLKPKPKDDDQTHKLAGKAVEDHMLNERWDVELDGVYYFNSVYDATTVVVPETADVTLVSTTPTGPNASKGYVGKCTQLVDNKCSGERKITYPFQGKNQISARLGGDYNILPGVFAIRAGVSWEQDGQNKEFNNLLQYMLGRWGIHGGFTIRVAERTDISFAFAHFIQKAVKLQINDGFSAPSGKYRGDRKTADYHFQPGLGVGDADGNGGGPKNGFDGVSKVELPNGDISRRDPGPDFIGAGKFYYNLEVVSLSFAQHF